MFGNLGFSELMIILVIVLVLFGAKRIPEISASFGKGIREFKKNVNEVERSITEPEPTRYDSRLAAGEPATAARDAGERGSAAGAEAPASDRDADARGRPVRYAHADAASIVPRARLARSARRTAAVQLRGDLLAAVVDLRRLPQIRRSTPAGAAAAAAGAAARGAPSSSPRRRHGRPASSRPRGARRPVASGESARSPR